jgi:hypothetical protein
LCLIVLVACPFLCLSFRLVTHFCFIWCCHSSYVGCHLFDVSVAVLWLYYECLVVFARMFRGCIMSVSWLYYEC